MTVKVNHRVNQKRDFFLSVPYWLLDVKGITTGDLLIWAHLNNQSDKYNITMRQLAKDLRKSLPTVSKGVARLKVACLLEVDEFQRNNRTYYKYTTYYSPIRCTYDKDSIDWERDPSKEEISQTDDIAKLKLLLSQTDDIAQLEPLLKKVIRSCERKLNTSVKESCTDPLKKVVHTKINPKIKSKTKREKIKQNGTDELTSKPNDLNKTPPAGGSLSLSDLKILDELGLGQASFAKSLKARKKKDQEQEPVFNDKEPKQEAYEPEKPNDDCSPSKDKKVKPEIDCLPIDDFFPKQHSEDKKEGLSDKAKISNRPLLPIYNYKGGYEDEDLHFAFEWADWLEDINNANGLHADIIDFAKSLSELRINYNYSIKDFKATKDLVRCNKFWVNKITTPNILLNKFNDGIACVIHLLNDIRKHEIEKNPFYYFDELQKEKEKGGPNNGKK